eukprot:186552-Prymnesium_polylepis.2
MSNTLCDDALTHPDLRGVHFRAGATQGTAAPNIATLDDCKAACLAAVPKCGGILYVATENHCYRKGKIHVDQCGTDAKFALHALEFPSPPSPPLVPPSPPRRPVGRGIAALNARFRAGRPSADLADVGVIMHREFSECDSTPVTTPSLRAVQAVTPQWDGLEEQGKPWRMCLHQCMCQGQFINGRISSMIVYKGLSERADRQAIPLPFGNRGGILLHPPHATVDCAYGIDGGTYRLGALDVCTAFCTPTSLVRSASVALTRSMLADYTTESLTDVHTIACNGNVWCGFNGAPAMAWAPRDLEKLLVTHASSGNAWHEPGFHSGYNEVILNSPGHNAQLPGAVEGFFVPRGQDPVTADLGFGIVIDAVQAHHAFLEEYGVSAEDVPMLELDPYNWEAPFAPYGGAGG